MRWFILILVLVNGVALYWFSARQENRINSDQHKDVRAVSAADKIMLVSELTPDGLLALSEVDVDVGLLMKAERQAQRAYSGQCVVIGPIVGEGVAARIVAGLRDVRINVGRWREEAEVAGYWLYLPPATNRSAAQRLVNELYAKGIESFIFEEGDLKRGLSLGVFSSFENAQRRRAAMRLKGYYPEISVQGKQAITHWLEFPVEFSSLLSKKFTEDVTRMAESIIISENECRVVATIK